MDITIIILVLPIGALAALSLLRFLFQIHRVNFYNGVVQFICRVTDIYCSAFRVVLPKSSRIDLSSLLAAYLLEVLAMYVYFYVQTSSFQLVPEFFIWGVLAIFGFALRVYFIALILTIIFSWVRPQGSSALSELSDQLINPLLNPVRKFLPSLGGLDFSPIMLFFVLYLLRNMWNAAAFALGMPPLVLFGA